MSPIFLDLGFIKIRWYGLMIAIAFAFGIYISTREAKRKEMDKDIIYDFSFYAFLGGLVGARLYYYLFITPSVIISNPLRLIAIWEGGLAIHGAILGGLISTIWFARKKGISFWKLADTITPGLILGQAIGRIGCFMNGDAFGYPTDLPWGVVFSPETPAGQVYPGKPLHPTQLYEFGLDIIIFSILWRIRAKERFNGFLFLIYVSLYSLIRIFVEIFRADRLIAGGISAAQLIGVISIIASLSFLVLLKKTQRGDK